MKNKNTVYEGNLEIETLQDAEKYKNLTSVTGDLYIYSPAKLDAPKLKSVGGNLYISSSAKLDAAKLESVGGNLRIYSSAKLDALKSVGGGLYISSSAKLDAAKLESVGGNLRIYSPAKLDAAKLESVGGGLYIYSSAKLDALKSVGGDLYIYSPAKLDAPKLKSVGGNLYISSSAKLDAAKLESVGGGLYIYSSAKLDALKSVGGNLRIYSPAKLDAPKLKSVGGDLYIYPKAELVANELYTGGYSKFKIYDGIPCVVLSSKQKGGIEILSCRRARIKNQKVVGDRFYIAQKNGQNAHGETIEEALREIEFKTGSRDISEYKNMPIATKKSPDEWAFVYRIVTGACQFGVRDFMEKKGKLKKEYTLKQIIAETKGAYGHDKFVGVVGGGA